MRLKITTTATYILSRMERTPTKRTRRWPKTSQTEAGVFVARLRRRAKPSAQEGAPSAATARPDGDSSTSKQRRSRRRLQERLEQRAAAQVPKRPTPPQGGGIGPAAEVAAEATSGRAVAESSMPPNPALRPCVVTGASLGSGQAGPLIIMHPETLVHIISIG